METPDWCVQQIKGTYGRVRVFNWPLLSCSQFAPDSRYRKLNPLYTNLVELACILFFCFFRFYKTQWQVQKPMGRRISILIYVLCGGIALEITIQTVYDRATVFASLVRPVIVAAFNAMMRHSGRSFLRDLRDSSVIIATIFVYIFLAALVAKTVFSPDFEFFQYFNDLGTSSYNMVILMTTANYPDVMMPAYAKNYFACLYFMAYLLIGLYLLMSLLLANVFNKFKQGFSAKVASNEELRRGMVEKAYDKFDSGAKGFLRPGELRQLLVFALDLKIRTRTGMEIYRNNLAKLGITERQNIDRELIISYLVDEGATSRRQEVETHGEVIDDSFVLMRRQSSIVTDHSAVRPAPVPLYASLDTSASSSGVPAMSVWRVKMQRRLTNII